VLYLIVGLLGGAAAAAIAVSRNRNPAAWFAIGFVLPLIGMIVVLVLPDETGIERRSGSSLPSRIEYAAPSPIPRSAKTPEDKSPVAQLERLAALRERGALTETEFDEKKRILLGRI
jgi:hypothetical protein